MFAPPLADKAGRGELCALIDRLAKDLVYRKERMDRDEYGRVQRKLDEARTRFHNLYGKKVKDQKSTRLNSSHRT